MADNKEYATYDLLLNDNLCVFWKDSGRSYMLHIERDQDPYDPRQECGNVATLACFHPRYDLGDTPGCKEPGEFWDVLLSRHVPEQDLYRAAVNGALKGFSPEILAKNGIDKGDMGEVLEAVHGAVLYGGQEGVAIAMEALKDKILWQPIWCYEHSGLALSYGERTGQFADRFDSCLAGWALVEKDKALAELGADETNWREKAQACIDSEMGAYIAYINGDSWGARLLRRRKDSPYPEGLSHEDGWDEVESCYGFLGDRLVSCGMADSMGEGLMEALKEYRWQTGWAESRTISITVWDFIKK